MSRVCVVWGHFRQLRTPERRRSVSKSADLDFGQRRDGEPSAQVARQPEPRRNSDQLALSGREGRVWGS